MKKETLADNQMARGEKSGISPLQGEGLGATPSESTQNVKKEKVQEFLKELKKDLKDDKDYPKEFRLFLTALKLKIDKLALEILGEGIVK